jgi:hypothetical protein
VKLCFSGNTRKYSVTHRAKNYKWSTSIKILFELKKDITVEDERERNSLMTNCVTSHVVCVYSAVFSFWYTHTQFSCFTSAFLVQKYKYSHLLRRLSDVASPDLLLRELIIG